MVNSKGKLLGDTLPNQVRIVGTAGPVEPDDKWISSSFTRMGPKFVLDQLFFSDQIFFPGPTFFQTQQFFR